MAQVSAAGTMLIEVATLSNIGGRETNEDASGVWSPPNALFCVVSDGAGGQGGGDVASKLAVTAALAALQRSPQCTRDTVHGALAAANQAVTAGQQGELRLRNMRATAVVFCCDALHRRAAWGHIGDSRLYYFAGRRIARQTRDHSVVQNMVDAGYIAADQLRAAPQRSRLFAALGEPANFAPVAEEIAIEGGDVFLLCTDGVWEQVTEQDMEQALAHASSAADWLARIEARVLEVQRERQDNFSAVAIWCSERSAGPAGATGSQMMGTQWT